MTKQALTFKEALSHRFDNEAVSTFGAEDAFGYTLADGPPPPFLAVKTKDGTGLNIRSAPTTSQANKIGAISDGSIVRVEGNATQADGYTWVPLTVVYVTGSGSVGMKGFGAGEFLVTSGPPPASAPKPPPPAPVLPKPGPPLNVKPPPGPSPAPSPGPLPPPKPVPPSPAVAKVPSKLPMLGFIAAGIAGIFGLAYFGKKLEEKK
jgi:hypothetical protein